MDIKERIYENIRALCKLQNEKISDIETDILGISAGYLSRASKGLKLEHVCELAKHFNVTIDDLVESDCWEVYKVQFAKHELIEAVERAMETMRGCDILNIVNEILEKR